MLCSIDFISENRADYDLLWKKGVKPRRATGDNMLQRIRDAI